MLLCRLSGCRGIQTPTPHMPWPPSPPPLPLLYLSYCKRSATHLLVIAVHVPHNGIRSKLVCRIHITCASAIRTGYVSKPCCKSIASSWPLESSFGDTWLLVMSNTSCLLVVKMSQKDVQLFLVIVMMESMHLMAPGLYYLLFGHNCVLCTSYV